MTEDPRHYYQGSAYQNKIEINLVMQTKTKLRKELDSLAEDGTHDRIRTRTSLTLNSS
ncbi:MAG TPA: hypothetical protein VFR94_00265 [Nitrososphaeraceae archaeon]|nr:hypothetical protein [Nitrososphaeraceae archaeon]